MNKRALYIDATSGISGDMLLGALLDLEVPVEVLHEAWNALSLDNYEVEIFETRRSGMRALRCRVRTEEEYGPHSWKDYQSILNASKLSDSLRKKTLALCRRLFEIEAKIHGASLQTLRLHEMGGTDLLIDVIGTLAAIDYLAPSTTVCSPVNTGKGFVQFSHGHYPIPTPATSKLLEGVPVFQNDVAGELTTPTGALLVTHLASSFGSLPTMTLEKVGTGAGEKEITGHPNVTRIYLGTGAAVPAEEVYMLESNIDDSNPQILAYFMEKALEQGALDVFFQPIFMKKNRPATRLSILVTEQTMDLIAQLLFTETTAIGLRYWKVGRQKLERSWTEVQLGRHRVRIKESYVDGTIANYQPEYEDCKTVAEATGQPIKQIIAQAIHQYLKRKE